MSAAENKAVFLSYASQDAETARRICDALRATGVEVWFDQSELVGGDAWDAKIRGQISSCTLFVPLISANTQARLEGYFRLEWKLAAQRTHTMADEKTFLLPVVIDTTRDVEAKVPAEFKTVQWTKLPGGETPEKFCARVKILLDRESAPVVAGVADRGPVSTKPATPRRPIFRSWLAPALVVGAALAALAIWQPWHGNKSPASSAAVGRAVPLTDVQQLVTRARKLFEKRDATFDDCALAEDYCKRALKLADDDGDVWAVYSELCGRIYAFGFDQTPGRLELSRTQAERALKLAPRSTEVRYAKAALLRLMGEDSLGDAEKILRELSVETPDDARVWIGLGKVVWRSNTGMNGIRKDLSRANEALGCFDRAAAIPAGRAEGLCERGVLLDQLGRFDEAEPAIDESLRLEPGIRVVAAKVGLASRRGDFAAAQAAIARLSAEARQDDDGVLTATWVWLMSGNADKCLDVLNAFPRDYLSGNPYRLPTDSVRAYAYELGGKTAAARSARQTALEVVERRLATQPRDAALLLEHANLLGLVGERERAVAALKLYDEIYPGPYFSDWWEMWVIAAHATVEPPDRTIDRLEALFKDQHGATLRSAYYFTALRSHPRFVALLARLEPSPNSTTTAPAADDKSVAVLAFANLSDDKGNEYFSDGISEELINALGKVPGLKVPARTSSFYFKGKSVPVPEIAKQLGVAYVVEGSVQRAGQKVKISARLSKAADGFQVWTDSFLREAKDVFAVEEEIAGLIAQQLSLKLGGATAGTKREVNPEAFELYLQAREAWRNRTPASLTRAEQLLNHALALEPNFARAHAALADVWLVQGQNADTISRFNQRDGPEYLRLVAKARQAITLDPESAEAHSSLGACWWIGWKRTEAEHELRRALALNSSYASAHHFLGRVLMDEGRVDESLAEFKLAVEHDPLSSRIADNYGEALANAGKYREALVVLERARQLQPDNTQADYFRASLLVSVGRADEGLAIVRDWPENDTGVRFPKAMVLALAGQREKARKLLADPESQKFIDPLNWFLLELPAQAFTKLDPAQARSIFVNNWLFAPNLDSVRADPRFVKFIEAVGLTEAHGRVQAWRAAHPAEKPASKP
jgi:TolB-like protein/Tfp pilus assembly protein PilF